MKRYDELMDLESVTITIETHVALLDGFAQAIEALDRPTATAGLHGIASILKEDSKQLNILFEQLFMALREDSENDEKPKNSKRKK